MAVDFQLAFPQELVNITQVSPIPGLTPRSLDIVGDDFSSVDDVRLNDISSPSFAVMSRTRLVAEVPDSLKNQTVTSVTVLSNKLSVTRQSLIRFRIGRTPSKVRGTLRLLQKFLLILFKRPGSDAFAPMIGGGALEILGETFGAEEGADIIRNFIISVDNTSRQILQIQARNPNLPADERLVAANVVSAGFNKNETALVATIDVISQAGTNATARLEL